MIGSSDPTILCPTTFDPEFLKNIPCSGIFVFAAPVLICSRYAFQINTELGPVQALYLEQNNTGVTSF